MRRTLVIIYVLAFIGCAPGGPINYKELTFPGYLPPRVIGNPASAHLVDVQYDEVSGKLFVIVRNDAVIVDGELNMARELEGVTTMNSVNVHVFGAKDGRVVLEKTVAGKITKYAGDKVTITLAVGDATVRLQ